MISQALMPLAPALAFPQHMSPGNYESAPSWLLLLCNAPVWSRRKKTRRRRRRRRRRRGSRSERSNRKSNKVINVIAAQRIHSEHLYILRISLPVALWLAALSLFLDWEGEERKKKRTSGCCSTHVVDRKYAGEAGRWGVAGEQERWWPPLSPAIIRQDSPEEVRNHHHIWSVLPFSFEVLFKKKKKKNIQDVREQFTESTAG